MDNTNFIILLLLIFLAIAIYNMYKLNKARIEFVNSYQEKLKQIIKLIDDEKGNEN